MMVAMVKKKMTLRTTKVMVAKEKKKKKTTNVRNGINAKTEKTIERNTRYHTRKW